MASGGNSWLTQDFGGDDEESDNDFNPGREAGSDAEDEDARDTKLNTTARRTNEQDDEEDDDTALPTNGNKSASPARRDRRPGEDEDEGGRDDEADNGEDDEGEGEDLNGDDDEEDEEEDEDDEDAVASRPRKRRRRGLNQFFEEEAEVDEDDDELEADEDDLGPDFIEPNHPDDDLPPEADQDDAGHRELDLKRQIETSMDLEKQAAAYKERYGRRTTTALSQGSFVPQNLLMPDVRDPSIWGIRCKQGKEREIVSKIMKKMLEGRGRNAVKICSVFQRGDGDGPMAAYIFVEALKKSDVDEALVNVADVYPRSKMTLVPIKEMPDLLRTRKDKELVAGDYVRVKKGLYAGDLAVIYDIAVPGIEVELRIVPRLDYGLNEDSAKPPGDVKRKRPNAFAAASLPKERPPPRLFNETEAKKRHERFLTRTGGLTRKDFKYQGETYINGFLLKNFRVQGIVTENVDPKLEEITKLTETADDGTETLDLEKLSHSLKSATADASYMPGDEVEVYDGEQRGIVGRTEAVKGNIISIEVTEGELVGQLVEVPVKGLRKKFREGDNVRIIGGSKYRDEVGMVLRIKDDKVSVLTNNNNEEITVFSKDLRETKDGGGGFAGNSEYDVQDLVQIDPTTVGIVTRADRESVRILDQNGSKLTRLPSQLQRTEVRKNAVATDKNGSEIRVGDTVRESSGESRSGMILHIHRGYVFGHNKLGIENSGIWVNRCTNVVTTAAKGGRITNPTTDLSKMNPALMNKPPGAPMAPPQRPGRDPLQGKLVHINKGNYKGHRAIVKDTTAGEARLELQTKNKTINVNKFDLSIIDNNTQNRTRYEDWVRQRGGPMAMRSGPGMGSGSRVPESSGFGSRTPMAAMDGMRTPAWNSSSRTPAWGGPSSSGGGLDTSRTPAWKGPSGSQTSYGGAGSGGMTSYGGVGNYSAGTGSRTPAWSANTKTPYGAGDYGSSANSGFDAFGGGSRTPAYNPSSSRTPAWGGPGSNSAASAPTPAARPYDAPTPGMSAPTPGASGSRYDDDAYTPYLSAPTPGASASGPHDAPTPAPPSFAKASNSIPLKNNRLAAFDAPTPAANAPTPYASGAFDAPTPAAGGPRYADDDEDDD